MVFTDGPVAPGFKPAGIVFGGPFPGFTEPSAPGLQDPEALVKTHIQVFKEQVEAAQEFRPYFINSHSCKDYFTQAMALEFFNQVIPWAKAKGYTVHHETHRKRALYSPWVTRDLVPSIDKDLTLVADLSHWINVAETDTSDPDLTRVIEALAPKFKHVHLRVGYDHGPQVPDPRLEPWLSYTEGHERWWDAIWRAAEARGDEEVCFTTEFGPPNYQLCEPVSQEPLALIHEVNHWIALRRQARFAQLYGGQNTSKLK
jgi:hypothetical protein